MDNFLCGSCCFKQKLSLDERLAMSQRLEQGINVCSGCSNQVKFPRYKGVRKSWRFF